MNSVVQLMSGVQVSWVCNDGVKEEVQ